MGGGGTKVVTAPLWDSIDALVNTPDALFASKFSLLVAGTVQYITNSYTYSIPNNFLKATVLNGGPSIALLPKWIDAGVTFDSVKYIGTLTFYNYGTGTDHTLQITLINWNATKPATNNAIVLDTASSAMSGMSDEASWKYKHSGVDITFDFALSHNGERKTLRYEYAFPRLYGSLTYQFDQSLSAGLSAYTGDVL